MLVGMVMTEKTAQTAADEIHRDENRAISVLLIAGGLTVRRRGRRLSSPVCVRVRPSVYPLPVRDPLTIELITVSCGSVLPQHSREGGATPRPHPPTPGGPPARAGPVVVR